MSSESGTPSVTECARFVSAQLRVHMPAGTYVPYADRINDLINAYEELKRELAEARERARVSEDAFKHMAEAYDSLVEEHAKLAALNAQRGETTEAKP